MRNYNRPSLRERLARFMAGRYGIDSLYYFILGVCILLIVINIFVNSFIISLIESALFVYAIFRFMSRNVYKRRKENDVFLKIVKKPKAFLSLTKQKFKDRKTHVFRKCPSCKNNLRLPKSKGKHTVHCPCCHNRFEVKI